VTYYMRSAISRGNFILHSYRESAMGRTRQKLRPN